MQVIDMSLLPVRVVTRYHVKIREKLWKLRLQCWCEQMATAMFHNARKTEDRVDIVNGRQFLLRLVLALTISCGALRVISVWVWEGDKIHAGGGGEPHVLSALISTITPPGLIDIHPVRVAPVLAPGGGSSTLARVLLLPQTVCDVLENRVERLLVHGVLARLGGVVFCERDEPRV